MTVAIDASQLGWGLAGFLLVMFFAYAWAGKGIGKKALQKGYDEGYHDRQHWETDKEIEGKLQRP